MAGSEEQGSSVAESGGTASPKSDGQHSAGQWRPIVTASIRFRSFGLGSSDGTHDTPWMLVGKRFPWGWSNWVGMLDADSWIGRQDDGCCFDTEAPPTGNPPTPTPGEPMTRKKKPSKPGSRPSIYSAERAEHEAEIIRLQRSGAIVNIDPRTKRMVSAWRSNVFTILLQSKTINQGHYNAAQTLIEDWAQWKGLDGRPDRGEFVDGGSGSVELITDRMIIAGKRVARTLDQVGPMDRALLSAFMKATVEEDRPMIWRGIVERETQITQRDRQSTVVIVALENLRRVVEAPARAVA